MPNWIEFKTIEFIILISPKFFQISRIFQNFLDFVKVHCNFLKLRWNKFKFNFIPVYRITQKNYIMNLFRPLAAKTGNWYFLISCLQGRGSFGAMTFCLTTLRLTGRTKHPCRNCDTTQIFLQFLLVWRSLCCVLMLIVIMFSVIILSLISTECHYSKCHSAQCH